MFSEAHKHLLVSLCKLVDKISCDSMDSSSDLPRHLLHVCYAPWPGDHLVSVCAALFKPNLQAEQTVFSKATSSPGSSTDPGSQWPNLHALTLLASSLCSLHILFQLHGSSPSGLGKYSLPLLCKTLCPLAGRSSTGPPQPPHPLLTHPEGSLPGKPSLQVEVAPP